MVFVCANEAVSSPAPKSTIAPYTFVVPSVLTSRTVLVGAGPTDVSSAANTVPPAFRDEDTLSLPSPAEIDAPSATVVKEIVSLPAPVSIDAPFMNQVSSVLLSVKDPLFESLELANAFTETVSSPSPVIIEAAVTCPNVVLPAISSAAVANKSPAVTLSLPAPVLIVETPSTLATAAPSVIETTSAPAPVVISPANAVYVVIVSLPLPEVIEISLSSWEAHVPELLPSAAVATPNVKSPVNLDASTTKVVPSSPSSVSFSSI